MISKFLRPLILPLLLLQAAGLCALNISSFTINKQGEAKAVFCGKLEVDNLEVKKTAAGPVLLMPEDRGGYKNIRIISKELDGLVKGCFSGVCALSPKSCPVSTAFAETIKVNEGKTLITKIIFDGSLKVTFLVSKYKREGKTLYRIKTPSDFKFTDKKLEQSVRKLLKGKAQEVL